MSITELAVYPQVNVINRSRDTSLFSTRHAYRTIPLNNKQVTMKYNLRPRLCSHLTDSETLLFYYRVRPHISTELSPIKAMVGWECPHFIVEEELSACAMSEWAVKVSEQSARIRDLLEEELSECDTIDLASPCPYHVGQPVLLQRLSRLQKKLPPYESGWVVKEIVSRSTVIVAKPEHQDKTVNIAILK